MKHTELPTIMTKVLFTVTALALLCDYVYIAGVRKQESTQFGTDLKVPLARSSVVG
jgi:hypothetical protein